MILSCCLSPYAAAHCRAATFDLGASNVATHSVDTALDGIASYVAAHCSDRADIAIDCDIGTRGGEGVDALVYLRDDVGGLVCRDVFVLEGYVCGLTELDAL